MTEREGEETRFRYNTEPGFSQRIDMLVDLATAKLAHGPLRFKRDVAHDFFLFGLAMVAKGDGPGDHLLLDAFNFAVGADGCASWNGTPPPGWPPGWPSVLRPEDFIVLEVEEIPPGPYIGPSGQLQGYEGWLAEWKKADAKLDSFMER